MAQKVVLIDDLDGSEGAETIRYSVDGQEYEIDLSEQNAQKFRKTIEEYIKASRRVETAPRPPSTVGRATTRRRTAGTSARSRSDLAEIRKWAQDQGMQVAERGRIKQEFIDAYDKAHK